MIGGSDRCHPDADPIDGLDFMTSNCPFCTQINSIPQPIHELVWEFPHSIAILGRWQFYRGYCVLISREHAHEPIDLPTLSRDGMMSEVWWLSQAIALAFKPRKLNYELLGNQVEHPHWHLFPRQNSDVEHLKPAWVRIDREENNSALRQLLEGMASERASTIASIATILHDLGAPKA